MNFQDILDTMNYIKNQSNVDLKTSVCWGKYKLLLNGVKIMTKLMEIIL